MRFHRPCSLALPAAALAALALLLPVGGHAHGNEGFLYGTVTTSAGQSYTGVLRWDDEESFWDDLFNSGKVELPDLERHGSGGGEGTKIRVLGREINIKWGKYTGGRQFAVRFGDIEKIEAEGADAATLVLKGGVRVRVEGSANDVEADVTVDDAAIGEVEVPWKRIKTVAFAATPSTVAPKGKRLRGKVGTRHGVYSGYIQWDSQECQTIDRLDGEDEGGVDVSLEMGKIRSIARRSSKSSTVTLRDGRELALEGTNDVDDSIRGILVEDARYGRVEVSWDTFRRVDFDEPGTSGPGYDSYRPLGELRGTVKARDGKQHRGRLVYDLDEGYGFEMLDGSIDDEVKFSIPFAKVAAIVPRGDDSADVVLRTGETLRLEEGQDVSAANDGVVVRGTGEDTFVPWAEIERIELEW